MCGGAAAAAWIVKAATGTVDMPSPRRAAVPCLDAVGRQPRRIPVIGHEDLKFEGGRALRWEGHVWIPVLAS